MVPFRKLTEIKRFFQNSFLKGAGGKLHQKLKSIKMLWKYFSKDSNKYKFNDISVF